MFTPKYKKKDPSQVSYYLHAALEWQFLTVDGTWYCALDPTYHYTRDGYQDPGPQRDPVDVLRTLLYEHHMRALGVDPQFERRTGRSVPIRSKMAPLHPLRAVGDQPAWRQVFQRRRDDSAHSD